MNAYRFNIPLKRTLSLKGENYSYREGLLLEQNGNWAEASPLPGFSQETIEDVIAALTGDQEAPPSLQFALEALESPLVCPVQIPFNHLLLGDREDILAKADACLESNCRAVKLKVGQGELRSDIQLVRQVWERLPDQVQLRLDANQNWSYEQAHEFVEALTDIDWEYIEEPLSDPNSLEELFSQTGVKYALDETLLQRDSFEHWPNATALICKPTILGGRATIERLAAMGKPIVFSAAFESGVGIARIMQLASEFAPQLPAGLDTLDWLTDDLLVDSLHKKNGLLVLDRFDVNTNDLERIEL